MAISTDYPRPITVNGFACNNCSDVSKAKRFQDPSAPTGAEVAPSQDAVSFGGTLAGRSVGAAAYSQPTPRALDRYA